MERLGVKHPESQNPQSIKAYLPEIKPRLILDLAFPGAEAAASCWAAAAAALGAAAAAIAGAAAAPPGKPSCPAKVSSLKGSRGGFKIPCISFSG